MLNAFVIQVKKNVSELQKPGQMLRKPVMPMATRLYIGRSKKQVFRSLK